MGTVTGSYGHIWMAPCNLDVIDSFYVKRQINDHDEAWIKGCISESALLYLKNCVGDTTVFSLFFESDGKEQLLFSGLILEAEMEELNGRQDVTLHFSGITKALDYRKKVLDYQDEAKTGKGMIEGIMKAYPDLSCHIAAGESRLEAFLLQYEETDFEFIRRLLSLEHQPLFTRSEGVCGEIYFGWPKTGASVDLNLISYEMEFDGAGYEADRKNQLGSANGKEYLKYRVARDEFLQIGDQVNALGRTLYVRAAEYSRIHGNSKNCYLLCEEAGMYACGRRNDNITGISLDGTITKVKRDRVKIELDATPRTGESKARWFSYSTAASSSDGSGWYCMPEIGEQIRLYFPTEKEEEAYVVCAIRSGGKGAGGGEGGGGRTSNPQNKSLATKDGQELRFTDSGADISCAGGTASINLNKDGTLDIVSMGDLDLSAGSSIRIRADGELLMQAKGKISLANKKGGSLKMLEQIEAKGKQIKNNS